MSLNSDLLINCLKDFESPHRVEKRMEYMIQQKKSLVSEENEFNQRKAECFNNLVLDFKHQLQNHMDCNYPISVIIRNINNNCNNDPILKAVEDFCKILSSRRYQCYVKYKSHTESYDTHCGDTCIVTDLHIKVYLKKSAKL